MELHLKELVLRDITGEITFKTPPIRNFWPDFLSGVLLFPKKNPPLRGGFLLFSKISPACGGDLLLSKDPYFCCKFSPVLP